MGLVCFALISVETGKSLMDYKSVDFILFLRKPWVANIELDELNFIIVCIATVLLEFVI